MKTKVGLLIDVNSFPQPDFEECTINENLPLEDGVSITSSSFTDSSMDIRLKDAKVHQLEEFILEQLTKEGTIRGEFDPSDFHFTYRYFNSADFVHPTKELRTFIPFNINSFETFERSLETEVSRAYGSGTELSPSVNRMSLMSSAFKAMVSDFDWSAESSESTSADMVHLPRTTSSSSIKSFNSTDSISPLSDSLDESFRNILYVFFRVPRDMDEMQLFVDDLPDKLDIATSSKHFLNALVSKAFLDMITRTYQMRVNFIDMWSLQNTTESSAIEPFNYPSSILKVLRHLHGGQIFHPRPSAPTAPGLPSWRVFLKNNLKSYMIQNSCRTASVDGGIANTLDTQYSGSSTPVHNFPKLEAIKNLVSSSSSHKKSSGSETRNLSSDRSSLRKGALFNSQIRSLSFSQPSRGRCIFHNELDFSFNMDFSLKKCFCEFQSSPEPAF